MGGRLVANVEAGERLREGRRDGLLCLADASKLARGMSDNGDCVTTCPESGTDGDWEDDALRCECNRTSGDPVLCFRSVRGTAVSGALPLQDQARDGCGQRMTSSSQISVALRDVHHVCCRSMTRSSSIDDLRGGWGEGFES
ncbi:hypothetical protein DIPPA_35481 [Diplonema papillatum]|nr:hypothetical protein DIPPA_35481 [Diplonema papillatum]